jgi:uncharacterized protein YejL (UPF0352 family)
MIEDDIIKQRQLLVNDLVDVIEKHKVHVGFPLICSDVIGAIEAVKLRYFLDNEGF